MRRMVKLLALSAVLAAALALTAFAADFTHCADALNELGLFQGTDSGYELDRAPNRTEAGVMLVRLLGAEEEALAAEAYTAPFTDVPNWARPYVQYLYDNGLVNGQTATLYGADAPCTAQHYATFLLRALGYSDAEGGDFTYDGALDFAREIGVVDAANCDEDNFLRDDVVAMSYTALSVAPKSGEADLLSKLTAEGAIADPKGYDQLFADYRAYLAAAGEEEAQNSSAMTMDVDMSMTMADLPYMDYAMTITAAVDVDPEHLDQSRMAMTGTMSAVVDPDMAAQLGISEEEARIEGEIAYYYADGWYYMNLAGQKVKLAMSLEELLAQSGSLTSLSAAQSEPISLLKSLSIEHARGVDTYTLVYAGGAMTALVENVLTAMPAEAVSAGPDEMTMEDVTVTAAVEDGVLTGMTVSMGMGMTAEGVPVSMDLSLTARDIAYGGDVTVTLPEDLDSYEEIIGGAVQ